MSGLPANHSWPLSPASTHHLLDSFDPRSVLAISLLYLMSVVSLPKYALLPSVVFFSVPVFITMASGISWLWLGKRMVWALPFIFMMASANIFFDPQIRMVIGEVPLSGGFISAWVILAKAVMTLWTALLLNRLFGMNQIVRALGRWKVPEIMTTQLLLLHRYLFVLMESARSLKRARDIRSFQRRDRSLKIAAALLNTLLFQTSARSVRIYQAMLARGFQGCFPENGASVFQSRDWLLLGWAGLVLLSLWAGVSISI